MRKDIQDLWTLAEPYVRDAGFDLVEVQSGREPTGWVVRLFIDCAPDRQVEQGQAAVSHSDCERVSRDISAALASYPMDFTVWSSLDTDDRA